VTMNHHEVRETFLSYFEKNGHKRVRSASLIPLGDPTLMFTNAGMNQFKDVFTGLETRDYRRATSSQKCLRVTGKHNDFEEVGRTARHHTFFEMLGNFSFGDYFKRDAIQFAWELFTEVFKLDPNRLYATVYLDDDEAWDIWEKDIGFPSGRLYRLGEADNYWSMGPTGPNGPCSELHYDMNPPQGRTRTAEEIEQGGDDAFVELWNLVFMQYNTDVHGRTSPLPNPSIDTGAGLERVTAAMQGVISNYDTDLFMPYINAVADLAGVNYGDDKAAESSVSCRVIADHLRSMSFLIADGAMPSNEGRGYVLRRIIRRAIRHGRLLGLTKPFLHRETGLVVDEMKSVFPELAESRDYIAKVVQSEEERFGKSFENSYNYFYKEGIEPAKAGGAEVVSGEIAFKAYDTYGMPLDLAEEIASEHGMVVDKEEFNGLLEGQRQKARASWKGSGEEQTDPLFHALLNEFGATDFVGYRYSESPNSVVQALIKDGARVEVLNEGEEGQILLNKTPFYAESGGQVGDIGTITGKDGAVEVLNTAKAVGELNVHKVKVSAGSIKAGESVEAKIDLPRRRAIQGNHTVTHIMHWALKDLLGDHVKQAGSLVAPDRVRFDFTHFSALDAHELDVFERTVNEKIRQADDVLASNSSLDEALSQGVTALFGEKYGDDVRVIRTGDYSAELCGGCHVKNTGEIGPFRVISEGSVAAGVRRIEAATGPKAVELIQEDRQLIDHAAGTIGATRESLVPTAEKLMLQNKELSKEVEALKLKLATAGGGESGPAYQVTEIGPYKIATQVTSGLNPGTMKNLADEIRSKIKSGVVLLGSGDDGKATVVLAATDDLKGTINCGTLIRDIAKHVQGGGGGSPTMAQAGGKDADNIPMAIDKGRELLSGLLEKA
jgi:alanyl-tRNA synthetase